MASEIDPRPRKLGQGRAAEVFSGRDAAGRPMVRKVFGGDGASKAVLWLLTGAPNPYAWCRAAIRAAVARRRVLELLVACWFGTRLRLPRTLGWRWNRGRRAYELRCELIDGRHAPLRGPRPAAAAGNPVRDLVANVMKPLQRHLEAAGFDGLLWQAGRGNPVAASNFMLEEPAAGEAPGRHRWVWIDLESGVPALFAANPLATLGFYLPKSLHHRRWLFDDVDVAKLVRYLGEHQDDLERAIGRDGLRQLYEQVADLHRHQQEWRSIPRHRRSIASELARGRITGEQAEHYRTRPLRWTARLAAAGAARAAAGVVAWAKRSLARLRALDLRRRLRQGWRFITSERQRARVARRLVAARILAWGERRFLEEADVDRLRAELARDDAGSYLTDFAVHLMVKPAVKTVQYLIVPALLALGWLDPASAALAIVAGGSVARTLYTAGRLVQAAVRGQRRPWVALSVGALPVVGNAAYPTQLLHSSGGESGELARFILYDACAAAGRAVPIWGGADSLTEHYANRLGDVAVRWLGRAAHAPRPAGESTAAEPA